METLLRKIAQVPSQVQVPRRSDFKLTRSEAKQIKRDKSSKAALDKLRDATKKHNEVALVRTALQQHDTNMGDPNYRAVRWDPHMHRYAHLSNLDLAQRALKAPASLSGLNFMRFTGLPTQPISRVVKRPETYRLDSESEGGGGWGSRRDTEGWGSRRDSEYWEEEGEASPGRSEGWQSPRPRGWYQGPTSPVSHRSSPASGRGRSSKK